MSWTEIGVAFGNTYIYMCIVYTDTDVAYVCHALCPMYVVASSVSKWSGCSIYCWYSCVANVSSCRVVLCARRMKQDVEWVLIVFYGYVIWISATLTDCTNMYTDDLSLMMGGLPAAASVTDIHVYMCCAAASCWGWQHSVLQLKERTNKKWKEKTQGNDDADTFQYVIYWFLEMEIIQS